MSYAERNTWVQLLGTVLAVTCYVVLVAGMWQGQPPAGPDWIWAMVWSIGGGLTLTIIGSITWNLAAGVKRGPETSMDERDTHIAHIAERTGNGFLVIAGIAAIVLCATSAAHFWIGQVIFAGFAVSSFVSSLTAAILYRVGAH